MSNESPKKRSDEWARRRARIEADGALETLQHLGFDVENINETQKDMLYLRRLRNTHENIGAKAVVGIVGLFFAGIGVLASYVWERITNG